MKDRNNIIACCLLGLSLLASCAQDDSLLGGSAADSRPALLGLSTLQAADMAGDEAATRAVVTPDYPQDKSIGFFVKEDVTNGYVACNNRIGTYDATRKLWLPTPDSIWLNNHDADIAIYAPHDPAQTTAAALTLTACLRPADGSKDLWCKRITVNNQSKNIAATLEHVYARLTVSVTRHADYKAEARLTTLALAGNEIYAGTTYKPFETVAYAYDGTPGLSVTPAAEQVLNTTTASATFDLLLIPTATTATLTGDITLTLTVDGKKMRVKVAKDKFSGTKLEAGKQYNINLKLMPGKLKLTSVSVLKWDALAEASGGQAEFDKAPDGIDLGLDFLIASGNLIANLMDDGITYKYSFAEDQGYYGGNGSYNDLFAWNSLKPTGADNQLGDWDPSLDPCSRIGKGWVTPLIEDLDALIAKGYVMGGNYVSETMGKSVQGAYFGTTSKSIAESDQDKYVFLPYAGYRLNAKWDRVGQNGYYRSRTPKDANRALYIQIGSGGLYPRDYNSRPYALSVRCIKYK